MFDLDLFFKQWDRPFNEASVGTVFDTEKGIGFIINATGIDEKDLVVEQKGRELKVSGKTEIKELERTSTMNYVVDIGRWVSRLVDIEFELKNGYLYIYLNLSEEKKIAINRRG